MAGTRAQSYDRYGSGTLQPGQVLGGSLPLLSPVIRHIYIYIGFKTFFYVVRHLDSIASYLPTGLHLGFFRSWPSLYLPSSFSSVFLVIKY